MRETILAIAAFATLIAFCDDPETASVTNTVIRSNVIEVKAWRRDVPAVRDGALDDETGVLASKIDTSSIEYVSEKASEVAEAASLGAISAVNGLFAATNGIPSRSEGFSLQFIRKSPANLMGHVVGEYSQGEYDYQYVRLTKYISEPPKRQVVYTTPSGDAKSECEWVSWTASGIKYNGYGGVHLCRFKRPSSVSGKSCLSYVKDIFGGENGFDFGTMAVFVDGSQTVTGVFTTKVSRAVIEIKNGAIISWE